MNQDNMNNFEGVNNVVEPQQPIYNVPPVQPMAQPAVEAYNAPVQTYSVPAQPVAEPQPVQTTVEPVYNAPVQSYDIPVQPAPESEYVAQVQQDNQDSMEKISNLNKEDAMEEALSHTNQYSPFEAPQEEVNQEVNMMSNKKALVFLGVILGIMLLFIIFLPQISKLIG